MIEQLIFGNLIFREDYGRKVIPFLKKELFQDQNDRVLFDLVESYVNKYNRFPTKEALAIDLSNKAGINDDQVKIIAKNIEDLSYDPKTELDWLIDKTEKFVQERSVYNAIMQSIQILDNKDPKNSKGAIPQILSEALSVSFDTNVGHDFFEDHEKRYEFYNRKEEKIPFNVEYLNKITKGGLKRKTLNVILAGTNVGKSLAMCSFAAGNIINGLNVLYITLEMAEEYISQRIEANLMNVSTDELEGMGKEEYLRKIEKVKGRVGSGKLIVKEYPTSMAGASNFRYLLEELKMKKNFVPDIVYIDYINICASSRLKMGSNVNSYTYVKAIAEEIRGLAMEYKLPIVTATQTTRGGYDNSDVGLSDTSESFGLPATADLMIALITNEELEMLGQYMVKQLKNRYNKKSDHRKFVIGVDYDKMRLYDVEDSSQTLIDDKPVMDKTEFGSRDSDFYKKKGKFNKKDFEGFS